MQDKEVYINIKTTQGDRNGWKIAAAKKNLTLNEWVNKILNKESKK